MKDSDREAQTREIIANAERLIAEANQALANADRFFADRNIDREQLMKQFHERNGDAAAKDVELELEKTIREVREEAERKLQHRQFDEVPTRRPRRSRNLV
jgi:ribonuclease I